MKHNSQKTIIVFLTLLILIFVITTQLLGVPFWWIFSGLKTLSIDPPPESEFSISFTPKTPETIGDEVLVTVCNSSDKIPVKNAKVLLQKDGAHIFDYYTDIDGQTIVEYVGDVSIIQVSKSNFTTVLQAIPNAPEKWVNSSIISLLIAVVGAIVGSLTTYLLENKFSIFQTP